MTNFQELMSQAKQMQEKLQQEMINLKVEASSGGGIVAVTMNGAKQLVSIRIDRQALENDNEMLQDLIMAAVNEAGRKVDESLGSQLGNLAGGLNLKGLF